MAPRPTARRRPVPTLPDSRAPAAPAPGGRVLAAYGVVGVVWGSTYLAIRVGVRYLPPALLAGMRFVTAGLLLLGLALALGRRLPRRIGDWITAGVVGVMLLGLGNGLVVWAEQYVESGAAAVFVVTSALWMAVFDAVVPGSHTRPTIRQFAALLLGFGGVVLLAGGDPGVIGSKGWLGPAGLVTASASWALGSVYSKRHPVEVSPYIHSALQMLAGGGFLLLVGVAAGEAGNLRLTLPGVGAVAYLIVFGSIVGYTNYVYLLRHAAPAFVGTNTYLNTVIAVLLGWIILDEHLTGRTVVAMAIVLGSVVWVRWEGTQAALTPGRAYPRTEASAGRNRDR